MKWERGCTHGGNNFNVQSGFAFGSAVIRLGRVCDHLLSCGFKSTAALIPVLQACYLCSHKIVVVL